MNVADRRFMGAAEDRERLPVALLSGFLGSGKTTLLNGLLQHPAMAGTAVAINEFGSVPLDQHLIEHGADKTVVMANGCLCCNLAGDIEDAVMRIFARRADGAVPWFSRLVVEPSGLADPAPIAQAILRNPAMAHALRLDGIITVIDALFGVQHLETQPECGRQVALADRIVLTKTDLLEAGANAGPVRAALARRNPLAPVLEVRHGAVEPSLLFGAHFLDVRATPLPLLPVGGALAAAPSQGHSHGGDTEAVVLTHDAPLGWDVVEPWLRRIRLGQSDALLRVKGFVDTGGAGPLVIQGVHHVLHPPVRLDAWPDADRRTRLVLILRGADPAPVRAGWSNLIS